MSDRPGRGGQPQAIYTTYAPLSVTQATRLVGRDRAVGGQVRMDENFPFILQVDGSQVRFQAEGPRTVQLTPGSCSRRPGGSSEGSRHRSFLTR